MSQQHTVLVTGANRGIGLAIAERFASEGYAVLLSGKDSVSTKQAADRLLEEGLEVSSVIMNVADRQTIKQTIETLDRPVDILINNAGVLPDGDLLTLSDDEIDRSFAVNTLAPLILARWVAPKMMESGYGRIVNVSSDWGSFAAGMGGPGTYGITKAALNAVTRRLASDLPDCIKVNAMNPGWVRTRMGGQSASRSPDMAADTAFWLGTLPESGPNGGFFYDRERIDW